MVANQKKQGASSREKRRLKYFILRSQGYNKGQACHICGYSRRQACRLEKKAEKHGSLADLPRSGCPIKYTHDVFERAYDVFVRDEPEDKWNTQDFFEHLKAKGVLPPKSDKRWFLQKWKRWLHGRDEHMEFYSTKEEFELKEEDYPKRVDYAKMMLAKLRLNPELRLVFVDETSMEHGLHPKSGGFKFSMLFNLTSISFHFLLHA